MENKTQFSLPYSIRQLALAYHLDVHPEDVEETRWGENNFEVNPHREKRGTEPEELANNVVELRKALDAIGMNFSTRKQLIAWGDMLADYFDPPKPKEVKAPIDDVRSRMVFDPPYMRKEEAAQKSFAWFCGVPYDDILAETPIESLSPQVVLLANNRFLRRWPDSNDAKAMALVAYNCISKRIKNEAPEFNTTTVLNTLYWLLYSSGDTTNKGNRENYHVFAIRDAFEGREIEDTRQDYETSDGEYLVVTDDEADELWDESLDNYIDECILHELPEQYRDFFDSEKWKDYAKSDGREHSLARYDGDENTVQITLDEFIEYIKPLLIEQGYDVEEVENMTDLWVDFSDDSGLSDLLAKGNISGIRPLYIYRTN